MTNSNAHARTHVFAARLLGAAASVALGAVATPALADDCGWGGVGFGISISSGYAGGFSSGWYNDGCFSVGYSAPVVYYASGPRHYRGGYGGYYGGYRYDDCSPRYNNYYYRRPSYRDYYRPNYYDRGYYRRSYRSYPRYRYDGCGYYSLNGESGGWSLDGFQTAGLSGSDSGILRYRSETYAGDPNLAPREYKVVMQRTGREMELDRAESLDPQWAGDAIAMLRKGQADDAIVALEQAAYPEMSGLQTAGFSPITSEPQEAVGSDPAAIISDMGGSVSTPVAETPANPEALRMLGLAMIADGQVDEGAAKITEAYRLDSTLASTPIDERLFPSGARFDIRDLVRKLSVRANRTNAPEAWFALGVLMQAEDRDSVALDMVLKASGAGLDQSIVSPMADSLRRVVYGRG